MKLGESVMAAAAILVKVIGKGEATGGKGGDVKQRSPRCPGSELSTNIRGRKEGRRESMPGQKRRVLVWGFFAGC